MRRGDVITVVLPRDLGKPRPAVIVQSDLFRYSDSLVVLPFTSKIEDVPTFRVLVEPTPANGLKVRSHVMIDKITNMRREKTGSVIGRLDEQDMGYIARQLTLFLGLA